MADTVQLSVAEYEALLTWARVGAEESDEALSFLSMRARVDRENGLRRYTLHIRYTPLPERMVGRVAGAPREDLKTLELTRPPTINDVRVALDGLQYHDSMVLVTADPLGQVGWYDLEHYKW